MVSVSSPLYLVGRPPQKRAVWSQFSSETAPRLIDSILRVADNVPRSWPLSHAKLFAQSLEDLLRPTTKGGGGRHPERFAYTPALLLKKSGHCRSPLQFHGVSSTPMA